MLGFVWIVLLCKIFKIFGVLRVRLAYKTLWPGGLGNYFVCKRFAVQTLLCLLEFAIQINLEHDNIPV